MEMFGLHSEQLTVAGCEMTQSRIMGGDKLFGFCSHLYPLPATLKAVLFWPCLEVWTFPRISQCDSFLKTILRLGAGET